MRRALALLTLAAALTPAPSALAQGDQARYRLAGGCFTLRANQDGAQPVTKRPDGTYAAQPGDAERFRLQATALGRYLLFDRAGRHATANNDDGTVTAQEQATERSDWEVTGTTDAFTLTTTGGRLTTGDGGRLRAAGDQTATTTWQFLPAEGCATFPEAELNVEGEPRRGVAEHTEVRGLFDAHLHMAAYEFLGGRLHCGRPWHPFGITRALVDCPDHYPNGQGAIAENALYGDPGRQHDPVGWPTFRDWPHPESLTHEQTYWRWVERAYRGGVRLIVNDSTDNAALCEIYPLKRNRCDEMENALLQIQRMREIEAYIDAQNGGPGRGWMRIVTNPFEARRVINEGRLAVVLGIEISEVFGCRQINDVPQCTTEQIDRQLDQVHRLGVRSIFPVHKFDNALGGTRFDANTTGVLVNTGNRYRTGQYWEAQPCNGATPDNPQYGAPTDQDVIANGFGALLPRGALPTYPPPPHCNPRGLTNLGEHLVRRMIQRRMIIEPDHMSARARDQALSILERERYSGVIASHGWSDPPSLTRMQRLGGVISPYAGDSVRFAADWRRSAETHDNRFIRGFGFGADSNGLGAQGRPRPDNRQNPVRYPFRSFDGSATIYRQRSGVRVFDVNTDGVAHYGLYPDWVEDLRQIAGQQIVDDLARGSEAYLQMWERADGVRGPTCRHRRLTIRPTEVGYVRMGATPEQVLRRAGQPLSRPGRAYRWCVVGEPNARFGAVFTPAQRVGLVATTARRHTVGDLTVGDRASRLRGRTRAYGPGIRIRRLRGTRARYVYGVSRGRIRFVGVASGEIARTRARLARALEEAGVR